MKTNANFNSKGEMGKDSAATDSIINFKMVKG